MQKPYVWTAAGTDITLRWKNLYGYIPASEQPDVKEKWKYFQNLPLRELDDKSKEAYEAVLKRAKVARIK